jgi:CBS domain-containing protein
VDVLDICGFTLDRFHTDSDNLRHGNHGFFNEQISHLLNFSKADPKIVISPKSSLHDLVKLFNAKRVHRVAVGSSNSSLSSIVTQSDVVKFLNSHIADVPNAKSSLVSLNLVRGVVSVMMDTSVSEAFETLYRNKVSGLALIDPNGGRVVANLSASDLRALSAKNFQTFDRSVFLYLTKSGQGVTHPRNVGESTTLEEVMKIMVEEKLHRVYITRGEESIRGVVSLSDIIRLVHPPHK